MILFAFFWANKSYEIDPFLSASKPYNIGEDPNSLTLVTKNVEKFISQPFLTTWQVFSNLGDNPCQPVNDFASYYMDARVIIGRLLHTSKVFNKIKRKE